VEDSLASKGSSKEFWKFLGRRVLVLLVVE